MNLNLLYYLREHLLEINWSHKFTEDTLIIFGEYSQYEVDNPNAKYIINIEHNYTTLKTDLFINKKEANYNNVLTKVYFSELNNFDNLIYKIVKDIWNRDRLYLFPNPPWKYY